MRVGLRMVGRQMSCLLVVLALAACAPTAPPSSQQSASAAAPPPAAAAGVLASSPALAPPATRLRVAWVSATAGYLPLHAARELGFFQKRGLDVELVFTSGPQSVQAVLARELDVSYADGGAIVRANLAGGDTIMLGATSTTLTMKLIVDPTVRRPDELRGKRLGITRAGSTTDFAARYLLRGL